MFWMRNKENNFPIHTLIWRLVVVSDKRKYVHKVLGNSLVKLPQEKVWLGELTVPT